VNIYGTAYNNVVVCSNGQMTMGAVGATAYNNVCLPSATFSATSAAVCPYWDDLRTDGAGQGIFTATTGVAPNQAFVIEWRAGYFSGPTGVADFEVIFYQNQTYFDMIYGTISGAGQGGGASATIGVQKQSSGPATSWTCNSGSAVAITNGTQLRYDCPSSTPPSGIGSAFPAKIDAGDTVTVNVAVTPGTGPASTGLAVTMDTSSMGGPAALTLFDDGLHGDGAAGDNTFGASFVSNSGLAAGTYVLPFIITDAQARSGSGSASDAVVTNVTHPSCPPGTAPVTFSNLISDHAAGTAGNSVRTFTFGGVDSVVALHVSGRAVSQNPATYASECQWKITPPGGAPITYIPGSGAGYTYFDVVNATIPISGGPPSAGVWTIETFESFDDAGIDTVWTSLCISYDSLSNPLVSGNTVTGMQGTNVLVTGTVTPGANPTSTGLAVTGDFSSVGGAAGTTMYDDGTHGDAVAGDNVFSLLVTLPCATTTGAHSIPLAVTDAQARSGAGAATVNVTAAAAETIAGTRAPACGPIGTVVTLTAQATGFGCPAAVLTNAVADATGIDGGNVVLHDDGVAPDVTAGDGIFSGSATVGPAALGGSHTITFTGTFSDGGTATTSVSYNVPAPDEAGDMPATALALNGPGPITDINGVIGDQNCGNNDADMYLIHICDPANFTAVVTPAGTTMSDTQLFLFRLDGTGVAQDDDDPLGVNGLLSRLNGPIVQTIAPGDYYLAISAYDKDPLDSASLDDIWAETPYNVVRAPDGANPGAAIAGWDTTGFNGGSYHIALTGVSGTPCVGSCCTNSTCNVTSQADCAAVGGFWTAGGTCTGPASCPPVCGSADFNCDGDVGTDSDIEAFFACLSGSCPGLPCISNADFNGDGDVGTDGDIEAFFRVLGGGSC
jgi:hypothetical protein